MTGGFFVFRARLFISGHIRENFFLYLILLALLTAGIMAGAMMVHVLPQDERTGLLQYIAVFFDRDKAAAFGWELYFGVLWQHLKILLLIWLAGFTIIGIPFIAFILFMRGFIIGFTAGFFISAYHLKGVLAVLAGVLPHNLFMLPVYGGICCAAIRFSLYLLRKRNAASQKLLSAAVNYSAASFLLMLAPLASAYIEVGIAPHLINWLLLLAG